ncbi:S41 family peptidase [Algoriphagus antarcticus]|nr:S41 family peptidase [Algoriphagus antarcticus]
MKKYLLFLSILSTFLSSPDSLAQQLTKRAIEKDLNHLDKILLTESSYQGLNGYDYQSDFKKFLESINRDQISTYDFGVFLAKTIGKIGDRHAYIKDYEIRDSLYFPIAFAPYQDKVLVVDYKPEENEYAFWDEEFPYLKSINSILIEKLIKQLLPAEILAPEASYFTNAVRELRDIELVSRRLDFPIPNPLSITLANDQGVEKVVHVNLVTGIKRARYWDERFFKNPFRLKEEQYNDKESIAGLFSLENKIGYMQVPEMVAKEDSPVFFEILNDFILKAKQTDALIIDVRDNGGGTRDLIQELAGYFIHPDSVYVVNAARQRRTSPLTQDQKEDLHRRFLFSKEELDTREQLSVENFMSTFHPRYELDDDKYSDYHYYLLNGQKLSEGKYHYNKPIYLLANERTFSAASILVSVFKDLPTISVVGVNTDGSSGNSQRFELPNSNLTGKISTMVSFQKNGDLLDGVGTTPDILIERSLNQIFMKEDYQLNKVIELIRSP